MFEVEIRNVRDHPGAGIGGKVLFTASTMSQHEKIFPAPDKLNEQEYGKFVLTNLAAKRAKQIKEGAPPLVRIDSAHPLSIALAEIAAGKIKPILGADAQQAELEEDYSALDDLGLDDVGLLLPGVDDDEDDDDGVDIDLDDLDGDDDEDDDDDEKDDSDEPKKSLADLLDDGDDDDDSDDDDDDDDSNVQESSGDMSLDDLAEEENEDDEDDE